MNDHISAPLCDDESDSTLLASGAWTGLVHHNGPAHASAMPIHQGNVGPTGYARFANPSVAALESQFRQLEGARHSLATSSGMAAVALALLGLAKAGDRILTHRTTFIGSESLMHKVLPQWGIKADAIDLRDSDALKNSLAQRPALLFFEILSNPALELLDAQAIIRTAQAAGVPVVVDNTLLTPLAARPLAYGATVVLHSASKYLGGHGDAIGGLVSTNSDKVYAHLSDVRRLLGSIMTPFNAYLISRGLVTLPARMARHMANARRLAAFLHGSPFVRHVDYPGLADDPSHSLASRTLDGFGGVLCFELHEPASIPDMLDSLTLCRTRHSFGEPATIIRADDRAPHRVRVSAGLEDPDDLIADLKQALNAAHSRTNQ